MEFGEHPNDRWFSGFWDEEPELEEQPYKLICEQCSEEFEGDDIPHDDKCPVCEVKLVEIE